MKLAVAFKMFFILFILLCGVFQALSLDRETIDLLTPDSSVGEGCGYLGCLPIKPGPGVKIFVHVVPYSHNELGHTASFEAHYTGMDNYVEPSNINVKRILDYTISELWAHEHRTFTYSDMPYFFHWWANRDETIRRMVYQLLRSGRLYFVGGGWSMSDEATTSYHAIIDHFTYALRKINATFLECGRPLVAWQADVLGHSREFASLMAQMGFDGLFINPISYDDELARMRRKALEFVWRGSDDLGPDSDIYTHKLFDGYWAPPGFCFGSQCKDPLLITSSRTFDNFVQRTVEFIRIMRERQAPFYNTKHVMVMMGMRDGYHDASVWFANIDKLLVTLNTRYQDVFMQYSTPACFLKAVYDSSPQLQTKQDDFFPLAYDRDSYAAGMYTSRPSIKYMAREGHRYLQIAKQVQVTARLGNNDAYFEEYKWINGAFQDHNIISGEMRHYVVKYYVHRMHVAKHAIVDKVLEKGFNKLRNNTAGTPTLIMCKFNMSRCHCTSGKHMFIVVYNPLPWPVTMPIRLPMFNVEQVVYDPSGKKVKAGLLEIPQPVQDMPGRQSEANMELVFIAEDLPPMGLRSYYLQRYQTGWERPKRSRKTKKAKRKKNFRREALFNISRDLHDYEYFDDGDEETNPTVYDKTTVTAPDNVTTTESNEIDDETTEKSTTTEATTNTTEENTTTTEATTNTTEENTTTTEATTNTTEENTTTTEETSASTEDNTTTTEETTATSEDNTTTTEETTATSEAVKTTSNNFIFNATEIDDEALAFSLKFDNTSTIKAELTTSSVEIDDVFSTTTTRKPITAVTDLSTENNATEKYYLPDRKTIPLITEATTKTAKGHLVTEATTKTAVKPTMRTSGFLSDSTKDVTLRPDAYEDNVFDYWSGYKSYKMNEHGYIRNKFARVNFDRKKRVKSMAVANGIHITLNIQMYYYVSDDPKRMGRKQRPPGAYLLRTMDAKAEILNNYEANVFKNQVVQEIHIKFCPWASVALRLYGHSPVLEVDWLVGPIPIADGLGKEVFIKYATNLTNNGVFYTDSNGRQTMKRILNLRPTYNHVNKDPIAGNIYPVTSKIYIEDLKQNVRFAVLNDRAQGGSSLQDGEINMLLHRRLLTEDGIEFATVNETEFGDGTVIRGQHYIYISKADHKPYKVFEKKLAKEIELKPQILSSPAWGYGFKGKSLWMSQRNEYSGLKSKLPLGVHILTLEQWNDRGLLLRFENFLEKADCVRTGNKRVFLKDLFSFMEVLSIKEMTLSAHMMLKDWVPLSWNKDKFVKNFNEGYGQSKFDFVDKESRVLHSVDVNGPIELAPQQIRTFVVQFRYLNNV